MVQKVNKTQKIQYILDNFDNALRLGHNDELFQAMDMFLVVRDNIEAMQVQSRSDTESDSSDSDDDSDETRMTRRRSMVPKKKIRIKFLFINNIILFINNNSFFL